ncbi:MAG TPA: hypothetical protein DEH78_28390 [Solibacterales bacterium]|nr:hypothetical protein [Bryobacterales bacterium]
MRRAALLLFVCAAGWPLRADLNAVKAEPRPERRSERALLNAGEALTRAREAWKAGKFDELKSALDEVRQSAEFSLATLKETGKHPSKLLKSYKNGEQRAKELDRRLKNFSAEAGLDDRPAIDEVHVSVQAIHEEFLLGVMARRK